MHSYICMYLCMHIVTITYRAAIGSRRILNNVVDDMRQSSCPEQRKPETGMLLAATATQHHFQFLGHCATLTLALRCRRCYCYSRSLCGCVCVRWWCYFLTTWDSRVTALSSLTYLCFYSFNLPTCCMGAVVICTLLWFASIFVAFLLESVDWSFGLGWCRCRRFTTSLHTHLQLLLFLLHAGTNANAHKYTHADTHTHTHTQCTERRHRHNKTRCTITT